MRVGTLIFVLFSFYVTENNASDLPSFNISMYDALPKILSELALKEKGTIADNVLFFLYTKNNPKKPFKIMYNNDTLLAESPYNASKPTKMVTHGWLSNSTTDACTTIRDGFLQRGDYNVIAVDWSAYSENLNYVYAAEKVKKTGCYVARMIHYLIKSGTNPANMTLAGHSLGAHVMGIAGFKTRNIAHVVGLDPAGPGFMLERPSGRITKLSGRLVEIIHTNAGIAGMPSPTGHADYYPNGGSLQPGCLSLACPHSRSYYYYAESLRLPDKWVAVSCGSYKDFLAEQCRETLVVPFPRWMAIDKPHAVYALRTNSSAPFGLGREGIRGVPDLTTGIESIGKGIAPSMEQWSPPIY